ncbi:MAG: chromosomal replication initiator protein DnaA [bacterium]
MNLEQFWRSVLESLETEVSRANFATWLRYTSALSLNESESELIVNVPNYFTKEWLQTKYSKLIINTVRNIKPEINRVQYVVGKKTSSENENAPSIIKIPEIIIENKPIYPIIKINESNLNSKYGFENYITGPNNELARQACLSISKFPGTEYNPLFIYGGVGLGKTHLIQATGNQILKNFPEKKVYYATSEKFLNEVLEAIGNRKTEDLRNKYRKIDALIIDDIQFLAGKKTTEEELFNTFNALYEQNKQIIISSDRLPKEIPALEHRLRSRFEGGMMVDIQKPNTETRFLILKKLTEIKNFPLSDAILNFLSVNFDNNIRELQGSLNTVIANFTLKGTKPSLEEVQLLLKNNIASRPKNNINFKHILKEVADFFNIPAQDIINKCRKKEIVYPRQIIMYILRTELNNSFPTIGEKLGGRDHTTVMHACDKIEKAIQEKSVVEKDVKIILEKIYTNAQQTS